MKILTYDCRTKFHLPFPVAFVLCLGNSIYYMAVGNTGLIYLSSDGGVKWASPTTVKGSLTGVITTPNTLHYTSLHHTTLHYTTLHYTTLHYTTQHNTTLHYTTLHYTTPHHTTPLLYLYNLCTSDFKKN